MHVSYSARFAISQQSAQTASRRTFGPGLPVQQIRYDSAIKELGHAVSCINRLKS
jgi:hypothetical protein